MTYALGVVIFAVGILRLGLPARGRPPADRQAVRHEGDPVLRRLRPDPVVVPARRDRVRRQGDPGRRLRQDRRDDPARGDRPGGRGPGVLALPALAAHGRARRRLGDPLRARDRDLLLRRDHDRPAQPGGAVVRADGRDAGHRPGHRLRRAGLRRSTRTTLRACRASDPAGPAKAAGLQHGDRDRRPSAARRSRRTATWSSTVRAAPAGTRRRGLRPRRRRGRRRRSTSCPTQRPQIDRPDRAGCRPSRRSASRSATRSAILHYSAVGGVGAAVDFTGYNDHGRPSRRSARFPSKIPNLIDAIGGQAARPEHADQRRRRQPGRRRGRPRSARRSSS